MDAAFFRFLGPELLSVLHGVRFDTVFCPAPGFWTLAFTPPISISPSSSPDCRFLLARVHSRDGIIFVSPIKPVNPLQPSAKAMWLRKRLRGRKVVGGLADWPRKRLALEISSGEGRYLLISMEGDPVVLEHLPDGFGEVPAWATPIAAAADPACPRSFRKALELEDSVERNALLESFLEGRYSGFFLNDSEVLSEGPLPWPSSRESMHFKSALEAAQTYGQTAFFSALAPPEVEPKKAEVRRKKRLDQLNQDQHRLEGLAKQQLFGEALAANLSTLDPRSKLGQRELEHPEQGPMVVPLDPSLTILENMERFFRKAAKGRRGQVHVARLRDEAEAGVLPPPRARPTTQAPDAPRTPVTGRGVPVHRFRSSDGFIILRGRNSAANHRLLSEMASPFDYWFHAEGGPGAHVILKRDHPGQEVPEASLREAAILAGLASWRSADSKASVLVAQALEVRKMKGAALGQVRLDSAKTLLVDLDPALEDRLRLVS